MIRLAKSVYDYHRLYRYIHRIYVHMDRIYLYMDRINRIYGLCKPYTPYIRIYGLRKPSYARGRTGLTSLRPVSVTPTTHPATVTNHPATPTTHPATHTTHPATHTTHPATPTTHARGRTGLTYLRPVSVISNPWTDLNHS
jgi:hypothetical protein